MNDDLVFRLRKRAEIRKQITTRKSVQNNEPDRIADLLEEAANRIVELEKEVFVLQNTLTNRVLNTYDGTRPSGQLSDEDIVNLYGKCCDLGNVGIINFARAIIKEMNNG